MSFTFNSHVEICGSVLEIRLALTNGALMANQDLADLLQGVSTLIRLFTDLANSKKLSAPDQAAIKAALADVRDAVDNLGSDQVPSVLTADVAAGATDIPVDSTAGWGKGEAFTTAAGTATDPGAVESGTVHATSPAPSPTMLRLSAGLANAHKSGETIG